MRNAKIDGYGETGLKSYPYHPEYSPDAYYPGPLTEDEMTARYRAAEQGYQAMHQYFTARAAAGDLRAMEVWDEVCKTITLGGYPGFCGGRSMPWNDSIRNPIVTGRDAA